MGDELVQLNRALAGGAFAGEQDDLPVVSRSFRTFSFG
jgi:hypothetical protein